MSEIDPVRWRELSAFLDDALELPSTERMAWLETLRMQRPTLADELHILLQRLETLESLKFLEEDPVGLFQRSLVGQTVGAYTLQSMIGHGGMGSVWLARRSDGRFEGQVAVKLLNIALMGRGGEERFRREGRVLAKLTHANIARILDAGLTQSAQPYLVLEYVQGSAIDSYCEEHRLDVEAQLRLFLDVLTAVGHAHANLIVHRDLKPSNILVTREGIVKLLDFGIAKLIEDEPQTVAPTILTFDGMRALTPQYAAPEQVLSAPITVATDVYSLGVLLYVLLCGQHPTGAGSTSPPQFIRALVDTEPVRPSTVAVASRVKRALRGDLDNILLKALEKNPLERYCSVGELADDLRRYLRNEPVLARADNAWYRMRKFVTRNRLPVSIGAAALIAIIATATIALFEAREAGIRRDQALAFSTRNEAVADFLNMLITEAASSDKPVTVRDMVERSETLARKSYPNDPQYRAAVFDMLGVYYSSNDAHERGESLLREALGISRGAADRDLVLKLTCDHAFTLATVGKMSQAIQQLQGVVAQSEVPAQRAVACLDYLGQTFLQSSDPANALKYEKLALQRLREVQYASPMLESMMLATIGYAEHLNGHNDVADQYYATAMEQLTRTGRDHSAEATNTLNGWGLVASGAGNPKHALEIYDRALKIFAENGIDAASQPSVSYNRTRTLEQVGRYREAREGYAQCAAAGELQRTPLTRVYCLLGLVSVSLAERDLTRAEKYLASAMVIVGEPLSPDYPAAPRLLTLRGLLAMHAGRRQEARANFDSVTTFSKTAFVTHEALRGRAQLNLEEGRLAAAEADARRTLVLAQEQQGGLPHSDRTGSAWLVLGEVLAKRGRAESAHEAFRQAVANLVDTVDPGHPLLLRSQELAAGAAH